MKQHGSSRRRQRGQRGMALGTVLALISLVTLAFLTLTNLAVAALRLTSNGRDKAISLSLAEAGIDQSVYQLKLNNNYSGTQNAAVAIEGGTYKVTVTAVSGTDNLKDVYSEGTTTNGKQCRVRARVNLSGLTIGNGAMISNGTVEIKGSVNVQTVDANNNPYGTPQKIADVRANGDITGNGSATVDGRVASAGTVSIGNVTATAGTKSGAAKIAFPTQTTINGWTQQWINDAKAGGTISGIDNNTFKNQNTSTITITGPKFINGDINLDGGNVTLVISGTGPIYVNGSVTMKGNSTIRNSTNLVVAGAFQQVGNTLDTYTTTPAPTYEANPNPSSPPPGLIVLSNDLTQAIALTGGAENNQYSLIYAVNGGIDVQGNTKVNGSLLAGGKGAKISASGNYTHSYPANSVNATKFATDPKVQSWIEM